MMKKNLEHQNLNKKKNNTKLELYEESKSKDLHREKRIIRNDRWKVCGYNIKCS